MINLHDQSQVRLRDQFAAMAICGAAGQLCHPDPLPLGQIAKWAYSLADAMLAERVLTPGARAAAVDARGDDAAGLDLTDPFIGAGEAPAVDPRN